MASSVVEIKESLTGEVHRFNCSLVERSAGELVVLYVVPGAVDLDGINIPPKTRSFGYFWESRPYNAYHFVTPQGKTLALYFNISDSTRIDMSVVTWRDLVVDVLVLPDGSVRQLDRELLPDTLPQALANHIHEVAAQLVGNARNLLSEMEQRTATYL